LFVEFFPLVEGPPTATEDTDDLDGTVDPPKRLERRNDERCVENMLVDLLDDDDIRDDDIRDDDIRDDDIRDDDIRDDAREVSDPSAVVE